MIAYLAVNSMLQRLGTQKKMRVEKKRSKIWGKTLATEKRPDAIEF